MEVKIFTTTNGFVIENEDGDKTCFEYCDTEDDDSQHNVEVQQRLVNHILMELAVFGSKHDKFRLRVEVEKNSGN